MDDIQIKEKIKELMGVFAIKGEQCSKIVELSFSTFKNCAGKSTKHKFSQKHLDRLVEFIKTDHIGNLVKIAKEL